MPGEYTFHEIVAHQGGLRRSQKAKLHDMFIYECKSHKDGDECCWCGGSGVRRKCSRLSCIEYGCDGAGDCEVTKREITEILVPK